MTSEVVFRVRVEDLKRALRQLLTNHDKRAAGDFADAMVSECVATFRTVGTSTELPVAGLSPGAARLPISAVEKIGRAVRTFHQREIQITISSGLLKVGSWRCRDEEISLGAIPDQTIDLPVNASVLDTLAVAELLSGDEIARQGFQNRLDSARRTAADAIARATVALAPLGVTENQVKELAEEHVRAVSRNLSRALGRLSKEP